MSVIDATRPLEVSIKHFTTRLPWWRVLVLGVLLAISLLISLLLVRVSPLNPNSTVSVVPFLSVWSWAFLPYAAACALIFFSKPAEGRWRWVEIGLILLGALLLRVILLPLPPNLSHDSWRYVWDARVFLHGYSPYVTVPGDKVLIPLRNFLLANSRFRNAPSLYPPGAEYIYALSYLLVPNSLYFLKGVFLLFDLASCGVLAILLALKGLDPARMLLYAWCPLPIVEFALQGHVDVITITFCLLSVLSIRNTSYRGRAMTGFLVGLATLTKLYPILLLAPLVRWRDWRRDWLLVLTCVLTIVVGYLPFYIQGHGQIFGFFSTYASEQGQNAGVIQLLVAWFGQQLHLALTTTVAQEHLVAFLLLTGVSLVIFLLRQYERISVESGILVLFGLVLAISSHVFPWYTTTLLPWIVLLLPARHTHLPVPLLMARLLLLIGPWIFACLSLLSYWQDWSTYYAWVYEPLVIELALAVLIASCYALRRFWLKGTAREN
jgi:hypothetical protein